MDDENTNGSGRKVCLDLFAGLGGFSVAFEESPDWRVVSVDNRRETDPNIVADVMNLAPSDLPNAKVVLAGHPCTLFSTAGIDLLLRVNAEESRHGISAWSKPSRFQPAL